MRTYIHGQVGVIAKLTLKESNTDIVVAATHLKAKKGFESVRAKQGLEFIHHITKACSNGEPLVLAGDFNDSPSSPVASLVKDGKASLKDGSSLGHMLSLQQTYPDEAYTTLKRRIVFKKDKIDYLFYTPRTLAPTEVLEIPSQDSFPENGLPAANYPSDHIAIKARYALL